MTMTETSPYPLILPLPEAARRMGVDEATLRHMVQSGKLRAFIDPEGAMYVQMTTQRENNLPVAVAEEVQHQPPDGDINARLSKIRREDFAHLEGVEIGLSDAAREFGVSPQTLYKWVKRGYIKVLRKEGRQNFVDKGDVAFCVAVYKARKPFGSRAPLLAEDGTPYLLKNPRLAALRRQAKNHNPQNS